MGNNYREVDLTANALINVGAIHESPALNSSTYSINSTNSTTKTLYTFQSDTIGNITNVGGVVNLDWNGRRLESISQGGTVVASYDYNIDGQRISKTANGVTTEYFYNGNILAGQKKGDDVLIFMYDNNGDIFGFTYNGTPYYYVKNAQNDVWLIVDENGEAAVLYQYDAWGKIILCLDGTEDNIASINPITYRSYYMDFDLGFFMYYLNSRYYMADWGRFVSADNLLDDRGMTTQNLFQYCANNPVMYADASGHALESIFDVLTLCISIVDVMANPTDPWAWLGLAGDIVDLVPFVTGVGEATKGLKLAYKAVDALDAAYDAARAGDKINDGLKTIYRSVSKSEADDIIATGQFNLPVGGMESKQFGFDLSETVNFGNKMKQNIVVSAKIPTSMLDDFYLGGKGGIDTTWFPSGTLTVYGDQLSDFNKAVKGTIKFME